MESSWASWNLRERFWISLFIFRIVLSQISGFSWNAGLIFSELMVRCRDCWKDLFHGRNILELGAGTGISSSSVLLHASPISVTVTDASLDIIRHTEESIRSSPSVFISLFFSDHYTSFSLVFSVSKSIEKRESRLSSNVGETIVSYHNVISSLPRI